MLLPAGGALARPAPRGAKSAGKGALRRWPAVQLDHLTTHERYQLCPDAAGHLPRRQLQGLRRFLRCHHTGRVHSIESRLPQLLYTVSHHFGDRAITVIAGYRAPKIALEKGNPRSPHKQGRAVDFRIEGVQLSDLRDYLLRAFDKVGVGYYPNSGFVHLDVGRKKRVSWIDYSHPGERSRYSPESATPPDADAVEADE